MKKRSLLCLCLVVISLGIISFSNNEQPGYTDNYHSAVKDFEASLQTLTEEIKRSDLNNAVDIERVRTRIYEARQELKTADIWLRYLEPLAYKKINGPLPVEWETEVFEKFEQPYKREGAGLTLAALYLDEENPEKDSLLHLVEASSIALNTFTADSITKQLSTYHHFFLCNRLYLLNLASIYTTGFECPASESVIPELKLMLTAVNKIYISFNKSFSQTPLPVNYLDLYSRLQTFVTNQPDDNTYFDHFTFIRDYIDPLFTLNQELILKYKVVSRNMLDYSLSKQATSIFDKKLYNGQNTKGIFHRVTDESALALVEDMGRKLFYDPILSGNNQRSCASCHKPAQYFTDTALSAAFHFNKNERLPRNAPSLVNAGFNHLLMLDGKHFGLQHQVKDVITNPAEMNCSEDDMMKKVLSCDDYAKGFKQLLKLTPQETEITAEHIASAITFYYSKFSGHYAPFDLAMSGKTQLPGDATRGFALFMSKAQCATCHFVPQFNGVKPPYIGSEFEVLGVPADTAFSKISPDEGRYKVNPAKETRSAFRTGSLRNIMHTAPYMHNGVFTTIEQVIDFYNAGGGAGRGLNVPNQTLSSDSLRLTASEKKDLIAFLKTLDEDIVFEQTPATLPRSKNKSLNTRKVGGEY